MNITDAELAKLRATKNEAEWRLVCNEIKSARHGEYPPDWWAKVIQSGLADSIIDARIRITTFP